MAMTSRERVLAAFAHEEPDHVPAWMGASPEFRELACRRLNLPDDEALLVYVGDDFRRVYARFGGPESAHPTHGLTCAGATFRSPFGVERHGYGYGQPFDHPLENATTLREIHEYTWPDPAWIDPSGIRQQARQWSGRYAILGGDWSPFFHDAIDLLGMETMLVMMYEQPELVDAVLAHVVDYYIGSSQRVFDAAADVIDVFFVGNDFGTQAGPIMGEALFRRFMLPHLKRLVDLGHTYGLQVMMHCCGGYCPLIPLMIEIGMDGLQSLQPSARGMEPVSLKRDFGDRILLNGCIDTHHVLIHGEPGLVRTRTREVLEIMKPGGGYVASPSHDYLLPETPVENVIAMYETVREFGGYD
jgi:uroporphyrinogen decarboxylase